MIFWDAATGAKQAVVHVRAGSVLRGAWSPDGETLAIACQDGRVVLWSVQAQSLF